MLHGRFLLYTSAIEALCIGLYFTIDSTILIISILELLISAKYPLILSINLTPIICIKSSQAINPVVTFPVDGILSLKHFEQASLYLFGIM